MSNSAQDILKSINDELGWLCYLRDYIPTDKHDGKIFKLEAMKAEIEFERNKINGVKRT